MGCCQWATAVCTQQLTTPTLQFIRVEIHQRYKYSRSITRAAVVPVLLVGQEDARFSQHLLSKIRQWLLACVCAAMVVRSSPKRGPRERGVIRLLLSSH